MTLTIYFCFTNSIYLTEILSLMWKCFFIVLLQVTFSTAIHAATIQGRVVANLVPVELATIQLQGTSFGTKTDSLGHFLIRSIPNGQFTVVVTALGFLTVEKNIMLTSNQNLELTFLLEPKQVAMQEVVVSATMKEVTKLQSPVPVEVYTAKFFKSNPTPTIFDALQHINGVRPQLNCNVCNTGDIHINGLEGPFTMVMIDGMPIVSGLSTVYGLSGIPPSLIDRVEIIKGPSSTLYGSEAVGGLINVITKRTTQAPRWSVDFFATSWSEYNLDLATKKQLKSAQTLLGINYFNYQNPIDRNNDQFTDLTLQHRVSAFNKWSFQRKQKRIFSVAGRGLLENRWGGDMRWNKNFYGTDSIYGEQITTKRWELFGTYQLPVKETVNFQFSANGHYQQSAYGQTLYNAKQYIGFGQYLWNKSFRNHDFMLGAALRFTFYDDNTAATSKIESSVEKNNPSRIFLPGLFMQHEYKFRNNQVLLLGMRYDFNSVHGSIFTPRLNYKWNSKNQLTTVRMGFGNGYRVANVFTEDHAALTGARQVVFESELKPETSWNGNLNVVNKVYSDKGLFITLDGSLFYTYFTNKIVADYTSNPNQIIYKNVHGYAVSKGISLNIDVDFKSTLKGQLGGTFMDVTNTEQQVKQRQLFSERFTAVWNFSYNLKKFGIMFNYTGNVYSPMRLPRLSVLDPRSAYSPWWSIQNIQITKRYGKQVECYGGIKNLLNWTPNKGNPFIIARSHDPFDKQVTFDSNGQALVTPENPYGLTFDPTYVYGPNQTRRLFLGFRFLLQ